MVFKFSEPFGRKIGKEIHIGLKQPLPLRRLIEELPEDLFEFVSDDNRLTDNKLLAHLLFFKEGRLIRLNETITNQDTIRVMLPVAGG